MGKRNYEIPVKRIEKLSKEDQLDLTFDLINAISMVQTPTETALLLEDLLTAGEVKNLGKRLRIAKLLLKAKTQREISEELHCSFATVAKVNLWLNQRGEGFKKVIAKLPKQYSMSKLPNRPLTYHLPETLIGLAGMALASNQKNRLEKFADAMDDKAIMDRSFSEAIDEDFRNRPRKKAI